MDDPEKKPLNLIRKPTPDSTYYCARLPDVPTYWNMVVLDMSGKYLWNIPKPKPVCA